MIVQKDFEVIDGRIPFPCDAEDILGIYDGMCWSWWEAPLTFGSYLQWNTVRLQVGRGEFLANRLTVKGSLYYQAYPTNCDGELLIPDVYEVKEAAIYYVLYKAISAGYKHPIISFNDARMLWESKMDKATNRLNFPRPDEMPYIMRDFVNPI